MPGQRCTRRPSSNTRRTALIVEVKYSPPYWVHAVLWLPAIIIVVGGGLRIVKAALMVLQYKHRAGEGKLES